MARKIATGTAHVLHAVNSAAKPVRKAGAEFKKVMITPLSQSLTLYAIIMAQEIREEYDRIEVNEQLKRFERVCKYATKVGLNEQFIKSTSAKVEAGQMTPAKGTERLSVAIMALRKTKEIGPMVHSMGDVENFIFGEFGDSPQS
tara:strand:- start:7506 stop:7940 length:435 start_codon:yes stop_codon:yes gene_type:complete